MSPKQQQAADALLAIFTEGGLAAPNIRDALGMTGADLSTAQAALQALIQRGDLIRLNEDVAIHKELYQESVSTILAAIQAQGGIGIGVVRDLLNTSRKYALPLLEQMDAVGFTRRTGDVRVLGPKARTKDAG